MTYSSVFAQGFPSFSNESPHLEKFLRPGQTRTVGHLPQAMVGTTRVLKETRIVTDYIPLNKTENQGIYSYE